MMTGKPATLLALTALLLAGGAGGASPTALERSAAIELLRGQTAEGQMVGRGASYHIYFGPDGVFRQRDAHGHRKHGKWFVNAAGAVCLHATRVRCYRIVPGKKGSYSLLGSVSDNVELTIEKLVEGNAHGL